MTEREPAAEDAAKQTDLVIKEARLARTEAEEAIQRIQQRVERLTELAEALYQAKSRANE